jgi:hypothetical protein
MNSLTSCHIRSRPSESSTPVSPDLRRRGISRTGAEDRNVPSFRALFERQNA